MDKDNNGVATLIGNNIPQPPSNPKRNQVIFSPVDDVEEVEGCATGGAASSVSSTINTDTLASQGPLLGRERERPTALPSVRRSPVGNNGPARPLDPSALQPNKPNGALTSPVFSNENQFDNHSVHLTPTESPDPGRGPSFSADVIKTAEAGNSKLNEKQEVGSGRSGDRVFLKRILSPVSRSKSDVVLAEAAEKKKSSAVRTSPTKSATDGGTYTRGDSGEHRSSNEDFGDSSAQPRLPAQSVKSFQESGNSNTDAGRSATMFTPTSRHEDHYVDVDAAEGGPGPRVVENASYADGVSAEVKETFHIPRLCHDDLLRGEDHVWRPGKPLRVAYITWNMANNNPRMDEVAAYLIHPNAHFVVVGTQENGPYIGTNRKQSKWAKTIARDCLDGQYTLVGKEHMWAIQMLVFARTRDVARYVSHQHSSLRKTGYMNGLGGNKGGVAVALALSMVPLPDRFPTDAASRAVSLQAQASASRRSDTVGPSTEVRAGSSGAVIADVSRRDRVARSADYSGADSPAAVTPPTYAQVVQGGAGPLGASVSAAPPEARGPSHAATGLSADNNDEEDLFTPREGLDNNGSFDNNTGMPHLQDNASADGEEERGRKSIPRFMTMLFITAHLAAHQGAITGRNKDYRQIVHGLRVGRRGRYNRFFKRLLRNQPIREKQVNGCADEEGATSEDELSSLEEDSEEEDVLPLRLPIVSTAPRKRKDKRDATEEFDLTFFGGDLNYRINGTRKSIEYVIQHHRNIRAILINNDQLSLERAKGSVFKRFQEGNLYFRPTYKYEVSASGGVTLDEYNFSHKKNRMPAYCDRILFKKRQNSAARRVAIRLYTDVANVRTSDHRPVVALFDVGTRAAAKD